MIMTIDWRIAAQLVAASAERAEENHRVVMFIEAHNLKRTPSSPLCRVGFPVYPPRASSRRTGLSADSSAWRQQKRPKCTAGLFHRPAHLQHVGGDGPNDSGSLVGYAGDNSAKLRHELFFVFLS